LGSTTAGTSSVMSLLELDRVCKSHGRGSCAARVLNGVSLEIDPGEMVAVWGMRRSGRSTLLRVAAGIEPPDEGVVRMEGRSLACRDGTALRSRIAYCHHSRHPLSTQSALDELLEDLLACGVETAPAGTRIHAALERTGASDCAPFRVSELDPAQRTRIAMARALLLAPRVLVADEPTLGVDLTQRDSILRLLRSLADDGIAVLTSTESTAGLFGADRALTLDRGSLRGEAAAGLAEVVPLRQTA
jgi:ABC-type multidrug transport system ATPase subunit